MRLACCGPKITMVLQIVAPNKISQQTNQLDIVFFLPGKILNGSDGSTDPTDKVLFVLWNI